MGKQALKIALVGKKGALNHWLEHAAGAWRAEGHDVRLAIVRRPWLAEPLERALADPIAWMLRQRLIGFAPELILAVGAYHVPQPLLEVIAGIPGRAPLIGWVGDAFGPEAAAKAGLYDLVAYTDRALMAEARGFGGRSMPLPHAIDPRRAPPRLPFESRDPRMLLVANPTALRRAVIAAVKEPMVVRGPGWRPTDGSIHDVQAGRVADARVPALYGGHRAALNVRNEINVLSGLNQRNFEPCLAGACLITDDQPDLSACFEPGREVLVWKSPDELNAHYLRVLAESAFAERIALAGQARVLAEHTFAHRLAALRAAVD
jgi:spore maturation protein CgeB